MDSLSACEPQHRRVPSISGSRQYFIAILLFNNEAVWSFMALYKCCIQTKVHKGKKGKVVPVP
jgi:hypothetical protein